ncbi:MAG: hypothetical protein RLZZ622_252 [Planctomycetota bacterium]|jgi:hypothetical protein
MTQPEEIYNEGREDTKTASTPDFGIHIRRSRKRLLAEWFG